MPSSTPSLTPLIILGLYLCSLLTLALFSKRLFRGTSKDYFVASHSIGPFLLLMSVFGTTMTAFALVGSTGKAFQRGVGTYGLMASSSGLIHAFCFFVIGIKLWAIGKKYGYVTQIQFFRNRFEIERSGIFVVPYSRAAGGALFVDWGDWLLPRDGAPHQGDVSQRICWI